LIFFFNPFAYTAAPTWHSELQQSPFLRQCTTTPRLGGEGWGRLSDATRGQSQLVMPPWALNALVTVTCSHRF